MLRVSCSDIGIDGCDLVAEGSKVRKVENAMMEHLRDAHPHMVRGLTDVEYRELETRIKNGMHGLLDDAAPRGAEKHPALRVSCADLGIADCGFVAEDRKVRKVEERFFDHVRDRHPELISGLTSEQHAEFEHRVKEAIRPA
jgi:predicted small metal-binding protein